VLFIGSIVKFNWKPVPLQCISKQRFRDIFALLEKFEKLTENQ